MSANKLFLLLTVVAFIGVTHSTPQEMVAALLQYKEMCINMSGSDEGYIQTLSGVQAAKICQLNQIDMIELQLDAASISTSNSARKDFFNKYCPKFNESIICYNDVLEGLAKCTGESYESTLPMFKDLAYGVVEIICRNDGQFVFDAQKPEFRTCLNHLTESVADCKVSDISNSVSMTKYNEAQCLEVENSKKCIERKINVCETREVYNLFEFLYNRAMKWSSCNQPAKVTELNDNKIDGTDSED